MSGVLEEVYEEAREEALREERRKDVFRMLKKNFSIEQIADIKDMKVEEVRALAAEVK